MARQLFLRSYGPYLLLIASWFGSAGAALEAVRPVLQWSRARRRYDAKIA
jgi:hypothetical protein